MSERTTVRRGPEHDRSGDNGQEVDTYDPSKKRRRRIYYLGAGGVAAVTLAAAVALGSSGSSHESEAPKAQPTAGASATPGETASQPASTETTPTAETDIEKMTVDNFDYVIDGQHYVGEDALKEAFGIPADKYSSADGVKITEAFFNKLTLWQNLEPTEGQKAAFENFTSASGRVGVGAMTDTFINPGFTYALSGTPPEGANTDGMTSPESWMHAQGELVNETAGNRALAQLEKQPGDKPYKSRQEVDEKGIQIPAYNDNQISVIVPVTWTDNGADNAVGRERSTPEGYNGVHTKNVSEYRKYSLSFMKNPEANTWDLVSAVTVQ